MRPAAEAEKLGIPSVVIASTGFVTVARLTGKSWGIENLRIAEYPGAIAIHSSIEIAKNIRNVLLDRMIESLTQRPEGSVSDTESSAANPAKAVFTGTFEEVNKFFSSREWTDGLPVVPPTIERVEKFLQYARRASGDEIAVLPPAKLRATPRNIAANAIMAGCKPQHMPLIMAAVEALGDEGYNLNNMGSTSGLLPYVLINGPIIKQLEIETGGQLVSKGPNPAIGRAIGLIVRNIAGYRPGKNYMGSFGYPMVFTLAENEEESPWEPFHVEHGFGKETSTVTMGVTNNWGHAPAPASARDKSGAQIALEVLCRELSKRVRLYNLPGQGDTAEKVMITLLLSPPVAKSLADSGYTKRAVKQYLYETARMPRRDFEWARKYTGGTRVTDADKPAAGINSEGRADRSNDMLRLLSSPDTVHVVVCGDSNRNRLMVFEGGHAEPATKEIKLP